MGRKLKYDTARLFHASAFVTSCRFLNEVNGCRVAAAPLAANPFTTNPSPLSRYHPRFLPSEWRFQRQAKPHPSKQYSGQKCLFKNQFSIVLFLRCSRVSIRRIRLRRRQSHSFDEWSSSLYPSSLNSSDLTPALQIQNFLN